MATGGLRNQDLLRNHLANLDLDFLLDSDGNADRVGLGLVFVHDVTDGDLVLLFASLRNANREVDGSSLLFGDQFANRHLTGAVFRTAELNRA